MTISITQIFKNKPAKNGHIASSAEAKSTADLAVKSNSLYDMLVTGTWQWAKGNGASFKF